MSMKKRILCMVLVVFIAGMSFSFSGCAGHYALFNKAHPVIGNLGGKWIGAIVNWIIGWPIVYPICLLADVFIFNLIEFWSGKNPIALGNSFDQTDENGNHLAAVINEDGTLSVTMTGTNGEITDYLFEREGNDFRVFDTEGTLISTHTVAYEEMVN